MTRHMVEHVAHLVKLERRTGKCIVLALEPEPCCFLETIEQCVSFFEGFLFGIESTKQLATTLEISQSHSSILLRKHLTLCLDLCHAAVEFESYDACITDLRAAGINIGKMQISAGLRIENVTRESIALLRPFEDDVYLHQVVEKHNKKLRRYPDLSDAFSALQNDTAEREWRVHFHVPIFLDDLGDFASTQFFVTEALDKHKVDPVTEHLEVETYTWSVLPKRYREQSLESVIIRELQWVKEKLS